MPGEPLTVRFKTEMEKFHPFLEARKDAVARSVTRAMRDVTAGLKADLREDVKRGGLGDRLANTWRGETYPKSKDSINAAAFVWSKAPKIVSAFDLGVTIRGANRKYLAIPTPDAGIQTGAGKRRRVSPESWTRETGVKLRFVPKSDHALLVADAHYVRQPARWRTRKSFKPIRHARLPGAKAYVVVFILVPQVTLRKRLSVAPHAQDWATKVPGLLAQYWSA
jgi:hypothetical protein